MRKFRYNKPVCLRDLRNLVLCQVPFGNLISGMLSRICSKLASDSPKYSIRSLLIIDPLCLFVDWIAPHLKIHCQCYFRWSATAYLLRCSSNQSIDIGFSPTCCPRSKFDRLREFPNSDSSPPARLANWDSWCYAIFLVSNDVF
jgi:hypothetical protein